MRIKPLPIVLFFITVFPVFGQDGTRLLSRQETETVFNALYSELSTINTMTVDFTQSRELPFFDDTLVSSGRCYFSDGRALRWEYTEPYRSLLIYRDGRAAKYDIVDGELRNIPQPEDMMAAVMGEILKWMKGDFSQAFDIYHISVWESDAAYRMSFQPKSADFAEFLAEITLIYDRSDSLIRSVVLTGSADDDLTLEFSSQQNNLDLDPRLFDPDRPLLP